MCRLRLQAEHRRHRQHFEDAGLRPRILFAPQHERVSLRQREHFSNGE
jgi:hypothetical protein